MGSRVGAGELTSDMLAPIPGCPHYIACKDGRIFSLHSMDWVAPTMSKRTGYLQVSICEGGKKLTRGVHRLVAEAFISRDDPSLVVNHIDEDKTNNSVENLEWVTCAENINHGTARKRARETVGIESLRESASRARAEYMRMHERPVTNVTTGQTFPSIREAAQAFGLRRTGIWGACNKRQKTCGGFEWAYAKGGEAS